MMLILLKFSFSSSQTDATLYDDVGTVDELMLNVLQTKNIFEKRSY